MSASLHPDQKDERARERLYDFVNALIEAADRVGGHGIPWRPFMRRAEVETELASRGLDLVVEGAPFDGNRVRFFAMRRTW